MPRAPRKTAPARPTITDNGSTFKFNFWEFCDVLRDHPGATNDISYEIFNFKGT